MRSFLSDYLLTTISTSNETEIEIVELYILADQANTRLLHHQHVRFIYSAFDIRSLWIGLYF